MSNYRHGHARQDNQTATYRAWASAARRCEDGEKMCLKDAAAIAGIRYRTVWMRIRERGWTAERALTQPVGG